MSIKFYNEEDRSLLSKCAKKLDNETRWNCVMRCFEGLKYKPASKEDIDRIKSLLEDIEITERQVKAMIEKLGKLPESED